MFGRFLNAGRSVIIFNADFSPFTVGPKTAVSILADTGLAFTRASTSTVQTSSSTIDNSPGIDDGCIGSINGTVKGLVIQPNTRNALTTNQPRDLNSWNAGSGATITSNFAAGPDGLVLADRANVLINGYGPYSAGGTSLQECYTVWQRSVTTSTMQIVMNNGNENASPAVCFNTGANTTWARLVLNNPGVSLQNFGSVDTRTTTGVGGTAAQARDVIVDYQQYEFGQYPTEAMAVGNSARGNDRLFVSYGANLIDSSKVRFYAKFFPKHSSAMTVYYDSGVFSGSVAAQYLWSFGGGSNINYAKIDNSTKKLVVRLNNGTAVTSTNAFSWAQYDQVEVNVEIGNGSTSIARYAINGGAWVDLVLANVPDAATCTGSFSFFLNEAIVTMTQDTGQLPCWLSQIKMYGTVSPLPSISSISTNLSPLAGGGAITINGINFDSGITGTIGGNDMHAVYVSSTQITGTIPVGTFGIKDIVVTNSTGKNSGSSGINLFNYYQNLVFNTLTPGSMTSAALVSAVPGVAGFTRAQTTVANSLATVQTSASTLESGVLLNKPRIFSDGTITGLLIEQHMTNFVPVDGGRKIQTGWNVSGQGTQVSNAADGPDGTVNGASRCNMGSTNQISNYWQLSGADTASRFTFSSWQRSTNFAANGDMQNTIANAANTHWASAVRLATNTWSRLVSSKQAVPMQYLYAVSTYNQSGDIPGQTARARDVLVDFMQLEPGDWATSAINTAAGGNPARPAEYLTWTASTVNSRLRMYLRCYPLFATSTSIQCTNVATDAIIVGQKAYLYYIDSSNYMYMKDSDKKIYVKVGGSSETASTNAISFTRDDDLEILWEAGNNIASVLKYRVNAGSWTDLVMTTFSGSATPSTNVTVCNSTAAANGDGEVFACRLRQIRSYPIDIAVTDL